MSNEEDGMEGEGFGGMGRRLVRTGSDWTREALVGTVGMGFE